MKAHLQKLLQQSLQTLVATGILKQLPEHIRLDHAKDKTQGDFATNIAMVLSKQAQLAPRVLAQHIVDNLAHSAQIDKVEVAGAGFINFFLCSDATVQIIPQILKARDQYGHSNVGKGRRVLLEFVSANPTGPLHVGHGRGAAYGASVANILRAVGFVVDCEYYVNDAGRQMDILATSVYLRYVGVDKNQFPDNGYQGDYIFEIATQIPLKIGDVAKIDLFPNVRPDAKHGGDKEQHIDDLIAHCKTALGVQYRAILTLAIDQILGGIKHDLKAFGVTYQRWFSEQSLVDSQLSQNTIVQLQTSGHIYSKDGALWFKTTEFGDDLDRVVVRENGLPTYFASDIAYHLDKLNRGYDQLINIWGADHHGYIARVKASIQALGKDPAKLTIILVQFAHLFRGAEKIPMSTRSGSFVTLEALYREVGVDSARFFYILRKADQHLDFDLELAQEQSRNNPVFYVQYAHARICSVLNKDEAQTSDSPDLARLSHPLERALIKRLGQYTSLVESAALSHAPHLIAYYLRDLSADLHSYYVACDFLIEDQTLQATRLTLIKAVAQILSNGLGLLGVSSPEEM